MAEVITEDSDIKGLDRYSKHYFLNPKGTHWKWIFANEVIDLTKLDKYDCSGCIKRINRPTVW